MCEFKPGDEVVCVRSDHNSPCLTHKGCVYVVSGIVKARKRYALALHGVDNGAPFGPPYFYGHNPDRFRKVQRRDLTAWLKTATKFEGPKRKKANA